MLTRSQRSASPRRSARGGGALGPWLLPASALHAGLLLAWLASRIDDPLAARPPLGSPTESDGELGWFEVEQELPELARNDSPPEASGSQAAAALSVRSPRAVVVARAPGEVAAVAPRSTARVPEAQAPAAAAGAEGSAAADAPRLSLDQLGVGARSNPFLTMPTAEVPLRRVLNQRVQQMLQTGLAAHDQEVGLGPEGPAALLAEKIVMDSATQPNTSGLLLIRTDASGIAVHVEVLQADNETQGWQRIAEELKRELAKKPLRVPSGSSGVSFQLRVVSRVQLPSGADPGLAVELFGVTVKEGDGDRSSRISVLSPKVTVTEIEVPYSNGATMPMLGFSPNVLGVLGDLADIGAVARRVVRAHLVALETHVEPAGAE